MSAAAGVFGSRLSYRSLDRIRKGFQLFAVLFLVAVPVLNWMGVRWVVGTLYSISIGGLDIADPMMALQATLLTREVLVPLLLAAAIPVLLALVLGRVFCSWMCPFNTIQEWLDSARRRVFKSRWLKARRRRVPRNPRPTLYWAIFAGLLAAALLAGLPLLAWLSAPGILSTQVSHAVFGMGVGLELALVGGLVVGEFALARRVWCKYACPVGATLSLCRTPWTLRVVQDAEKCQCKTGAEACQIACPLGLTPLVGGLAPSCFNCGSCIAACEKMRRGALSFGFGVANGRAVPGSLEQPLEVR
jgi:ferredoxin-type protein NapH